MRETCRPWTDPDPALSDHRAGVEDVETFASGPHPGRATHRRTSRGWPSLRERVEEVDREEGELAGECLGSVRGAEGARDLPNGPPGCFGDSPRLRCDRPEGGVRTGWSREPDAPLRRIGQGL